MMIVSGNCRRRVGCRWIVSALTQIPGNKTLVFVPENLAIFVDLLLDLPFMAADSLHSP